MLLGVRAQDRSVDREVRRAVGERNPFEQRGVRVEHRGRDRRILRVDRGFERLEVGVGRTGLDVDLGGAAPDHDDPVAQVLVLEGVDVGADLLEHRPLRRLGHHVGAVEALHVVRIERRGHRPDRVQRVADGFEVASLVEHAGA